MDIKKAKKGQRRCEGCESVEAVKVGEGIKKVGRV